MILLAALLLDYQAHSVRPNIQSPRYSFPSCFSPRERISIFRSTQTQAESMPLQRELARSFKVTSTLKDKIIRYSHPVIFLSSVQGRCVPRGSPKAKIITIDLDAPGASPLRPPKKSQRTWKSPTRSTVVVIKAAQSCTTDNLPKVRGLARSSQKTTGISPWALSLTESASQVVVCSPHEQFKRLKLHPNGSQCQV